MLILTSNIFACQSADNFDGSYKGVLVYSRNSDVIHREKCGETKNIKKENYCVSTKSVIEMINNNFRPCHVCLHYYLNSAEILNMYVDSSDIDNFKNILVDQFGFWPNRESNNDILNSFVYLYEGLLNSTSNVFDANAEYFRLIASLVYTRDGLGYNNMDWSIVAGLYNNSNETKNVIIDKFSNVQNLEDEALREANAQAGYIGDICGVNNAMPSLTVGDYAADLDAVY